MRLIRSTFFLFIFLVVFSTCLNFTFGQSCTNPNPANCDNIGSCKDITLNQTITTTCADKNYSARDFIRLSPGFQYQPQTGKKFHAWVDKSMQITDYDDQGSYDEDDFPVPIDLTKTVGLTLGVANVTSNGAAVYSMPISVPPGTAGIQPSLSLMYYSNGGNGIMGPGWLLEGLSSITRTGKTFYNNDKKTGESLLNTTDVYMLDGKRLVAVGTGDYFSANQEYRTEEESFVHVTAIGSSGEGPLSFIAQTRDGLTLTYGGVPNARIDNNSEQTVIAWRINKLEDQCGNYMEFIYNNDNQSENESYIEEIKYTQNDNAGLEHYNRIKFYYQKRDDQYIRYMGGVKIKSSLLLRMIEIISADEILKKYQLVYALRNGKSYLKEIIEHSGNGNALNPTRFLYGTPPLNINTGFNANALSNDINKGIFSIGDFNGDGLDDFLAFPPQIADQTATGTINDATFNVSVSVEDLNIDYINVDLDLNCISEVDEPSPEELENDIRNEKESELEDILPEQIETESKNEITNQIEDNLIDDLQTDLENALNDNLSEIQPQYYYDSWQLYLNDSYNGSEGLDYTSTGGGGSFDVGNIQINVNKNSCIRYEINETINFDQTQTSNFDYNYITIEDCTVDDVETQCEVEAICYDNTATIEYAVEAELNINVDFNFNYTIDYELTSNSIASVSADFDYDGKSDALIYNRYGTGMDDGNQLIENVLSIWKSTGSNLTQIFSINPIVTLAENPTLFIVGDFDGNGSSDLLVHNNGNIKLYFISSADGTVNTSIDMNGYVDWGTPKALFPMDYNGNGITDIMVVDNEGSKIFEIELEIRQGDGVDFMGIDQLYSGSFPTHSDEFKIGDLNSDGNSDIFSKSKILYSTAAKPGSAGNKFEEKTISFLSCVSGKTDNTDNTTGTPCDNIISVNQSGEIDYYSGLVNEDYSIPSGKTYPKCEEYLVEINGDELTDIIHCIKLSPDEIDFYLYINNGFNSAGNPNFTLLQQFTIDEAVEIKGFGDFNGDNKLDMVLGFNNGDVEVYYFKPHTKERLLKSVSDGFGRLTSFEYTTINNPGSDVENVYEPISSSAGAATFQFNKGVTVVKTLTTDNGIGGNFVHSYFYYGGVFHKEGKGFMGFRHFGDFDNTTNVKITTDNYFKQSVGQTDIYGKFIDQIFIEGFGPDDSYIDFTNTVHHYGDKRVFTYPASIEIFNGMTNQSIIQGIQTMNLAIGKPLENYILFENAETIEITNTYTGFSPGGSAWPFNSLLRTKTTYKERIRTGDGDPYSRQIFYDYNNNGKLIQVISDKDKKDANPNENKSVTTDYIINASTFFGKLGLPEMIQNTAITANYGGLEETRSLLLEYDNTGRFITKTTNDEQLEVNSEYDLKWGTLLSETDVAGNARNFEYDDFGRLKNAIDVRGNQMEFSYHWETNRTNPEDPVYFIQSSGSNLPAEKKYYDLLNRWVKTENNPYGYDMMVKTAYNNLGKISSTSLPGAVGSAIEEISYTYDNFLRLKTKTINNMETEYNYTSAYNDFNKIESATYSDALSENITLSVSYDATGKVIKSVDEQGNILTTNYHGCGKPSIIKGNGSSLLENAYDDYGYLTGTIRDGTFESESYYNGFGELESYTDPRGNTFEYFYDILGRLSQTLSASNDNEITYDYYANGESGAGLIKSITDNKPADISTSKEFSYNNFGEMLMERETITGEIFTTRYAYDNLGRLLTKEFPSGFKTGFGYSEEGYFKSINNITPGDPETQIWETVAITSFGKYSEVIKGDGKTTQKGYDNLGILSSIYVPGVQNMTFSFDNQLGNLTLRKQFGTGICTNPDIEEGFTYDKTSRLLSSTAIMTCDDGLQIISETMDATDITYKDALGYPDQIGNIAEKSLVGEYSYEGDSKFAVTQVSNQGDLIPETEQNIEYTAFSKASKITECDKILDIIYGSDDQRKKTIYTVAGNTEKIKYFTDAGFEKVIAGNTTYELSYVGSQEGLEAIHVKEDNDGTISAGLYFVYKDHLGSIIAVTDEAGDVVHKANYDAWGRKRNPDRWDYTDYTGPTLPWLDRGFTGHEHLDEFGLINMNGRMYDPLLGRMLSPDPIISNPLNPQNYNSYSYVLNNPLKYIDPSGNTSHDVIFPPGSITLQEFEFIEYTNNDFNYDIEPGMSFDFLNDAFVDFNVEFSFENIELMTLILPNLSVNINPGNIKSITQSILITGIESIKNTAQNISNNVAQGGGGDGSNWISNLRTAAGLTVDWALGVGSDNYTFVNSPAANAMRNSPGVVQARNDYYKTGKTSGGYNFGLKGLMNAGIDPIEQFVGSYNYNISVVGNNLQFTLINTTSFSSAAYHLWPSSWNWNSGPMGNTTQTYIFTEPYFK